MFDEEYNEDDADDLDPNSLEARFEKHSEKYFLKKPKGANLPHPSTFISACLKIASLMKKPKEFDVHAEHDVVYFCGEREMKPLTDEDIIYLVQCGVHYDTEGDCLANFC